MCSNRWPNKAPPESGSSLTRPPCKDCEGGIGTDRRPDASFDNLSLESSAYNAFELILGARADEAAVLMKSGTGKRGGGFEAPRPTSDDALGASLKSKTGSDSGIALIGERELGVTLRLPARHDENGAKGLLESSYTDAELGASTCEVLRCKTLLSDIAEPAGPVEMRRPCSSITRDPA